jgi:membrane glycosyltransferase
VFDSRSKHEDVESSLVLQQRRWCSGNINAFQAFALGSIPGRRMNDLFLLIVIPLSQAAESDC